MKDFSGAMVDYEKGLRLDCGNLESAAIGGEEIAIKELDELIASDPKSQGALFFRAVAKGQRRTTLPRSKTSTN